MKTIKRRRKENKTDYLKRIKLLKSESPRLVFRKTNRYIIAQYILSNESQDKIILTVTSKKLLKYGWPKELKGSLKSIPAAYLVGFLIGKKIVKEKIRKPIADFGMNRTNHKSKPYAFLKGVIDSGVEVKCPDETFPEEERIKGKKLIEDFSKFFDEIKLKIQKE